jgi:predicted transcriptional regulator
MLSIRPKWCKKIVNGEKTIEVRKTRPNIATPFKCYIYCTMDHPYISVSCMELDKLNYRTNTVGRCNGKVIGEFTCERIALIAYDGGELSSTTNAAFSPATCLTQAEIIAYIGDKGRCYGWHISDLLIYDQPKGLSEFQRATDPCVFCMERIARECTDCKKFGGNIKRPPQSWCYVEAMKDE